MFRRFRINGSRLTSFVAGALMLLCVNAFAQPDTLWTKTYGGTDYDWGKSVQECAGGGFVIAGVTKSFDAGADDVYLIRTNADGDTLWTKTYGGTFDDRGFSVQECAEGGFIIAGETRSFGAGADDVYLIRTNADGDTLWTKTYGGTKWDKGSSVQECADSGFIIAGETSSFGAGESDIYLIRTNADGDTLWTKTYGGTNYDYGESVQECANEDFIIAGHTSSFGAGGKDAYLIRTNADGDTLWTKTYGGTDRDYGYSVQQCADGGFIIAGETESFGAGKSDVYLIRTEAIRLTSPNGGEAWAGGSYNIIWWCEDSAAIDHYRLLYSTNGGSTYPDTIAHNIANTNTSYFWTLPPINSTTCRVKVQAIGAGDSVLAEDWSDADFEIDATPPANITDLEAIDRTYNLIEIRWTVPGDDSLSGGPATEYNIRYSFEPITTSNWSSATQCSGEPTPGTPGGTQSFTVKPLLADTFYYFAMKTRDNVYNWSGLSNVASDSTKPYPVLAGSQYPMFHYDLAHTGKSPYYGYLDDNIKWYFATGSSVTGSPIIAPDGTIYFTSENDLLYALNIDGTKKLQWSLVNATKSTPAIAINSTIYIGDGNGTLHAYYSNSTSPKWEYDVSGATETSPVIGSDGAIYFGSTNDTVYAVNADGTLKWKFATGGDILSSPAISPDGIVYVGSNDHKLWAIKPNGDEAWSVSTPGAVISSPAVDTGTGIIYVGSCNGKLYAINPNGTIDNTFTAGDTITSSPAIGADGTIFFGSYDGKVYALDSGLNLKWEYQTGGKIESSPAIDARGYVYIGSDDGTFYCFKGSDSTVVWSAITGDAITSSPAIAANSCVYVGSNDGRLYAFGPNAPVQVISPNGGERWQKNTVHSIYWSTTGSIVNIKLHYSLNSGTSWKLISDSEIDDGIYPWTVPDTVCSTCRVKVIAFDAGGDSAVDISDADFSITETGTEEIDATIPKVFLLSQNSPNPFTGATEIRYGLPKDSNVEITVYNLLGQKVKTLVDENRKAGYHSVNWNGKNNSDKRVAKGIYFYRMEAGNYKATRKLTILR